MYRPLISVIIPVYNRPLFLRRAVDSVFAQTYKNFELIIIDDGSTDATINVIQKYSSSKIKTIRQKHQGVSSARNKGIQISQGDFIGFLDSDDIWHPNKLEKQISFFKNHPASQICQTDEIWVRKGKRVNPKVKHKKQTGLFFKEALNLCLVTTSSILCRKELFENVEPFDKALPACEDYDLYLRILAQDIEIPLIAEALLTRYGGHKDQLSAKYWGMDRFRIKTLLKLLKTDISSENKNAVRKILNKKLKILKTGAEKRIKLFSYLKYSLLLYFFTRKSLFSKSPH